MLFLGWGAQRGGALIAPTLKRFVAEKARDKAAVMKEGRKLQEELKLLKPYHPKQKGESKGGPKGGPKGQGKKGQETAVATAASS